MQFCPKCGVENADISSYCAACGQKLGAYKEFDANANTPYPDQNQVRPPSLVAVSVIVLIFCCTIGGIVSLVYAVQANSEKDIQRSWELYNKSKNWNITSAIIGIILIPIFVIIRVYASR